MLIVSTPGWKRKCPYWSMTMAWSLLLRRYNSRHCCCICGMGQDKFPGDIQCFSCEEERPFALNTARCSTEVEKKLPPGRITWSGNKVPFLNPKLPSLPHPLCPPLWYLCRTIINLHYFAGRTHPSCHGWVRDIPQGVYLSSLDRTQI